MTTDKSWTTEDETRFIATDERIRYFNGLPAFVRNALIIAQGGDVSGDNGDALSWLENRKLTVQCSADILTDGDWATLNHLDALINDLRKAGCDTTPIKGRSAN
jgi:hypothetical protein